MQRSCTPYGTTEELEMIQRAGEVVENGCCERVMIAGIGGQGILLAGKLLAQTAMVKGFEVTYMPSYGAEVRGGTAKCMVVVSEEPIASPIISQADGMVMMNQASFDRYCGQLKQGGLMVINSSQVKETEARGDVEVLEVPADEIATELGSVRSANMAVLGAFLERRRIVSLDEVIAALPAVLAKRYHNTLDMNAQAIRRGAECAAAKSTA